MSVGLKFHGKVEVRWIDSIFGEVRSGDTYNPDGAY
jgi:hypothetical protein